MEWTIFLDNFLDHFFWDHFKGEGKHTVSAEGGVGGRVLLLREWYLILIMKCLLPSTYKMVQKMVRKDGPKKRSKKLSIKQC